MRPQTVTVSSQAASAPIPVDARQTPFNLSFAVTGTFSATYTVQHTLSDVLGGATAVWFDNSAVAGETTAQDGNYAYPITAIRLNCTAYTSGSMTLTVLQGK